LLLPPTGSGSLVDVSGIAGVLVALAGVGLVLVTRRRGAAPR
jgi:hypothetical protein